MATIEIGAAPKFNPSVEGAVFEWNVLKALIIVAKHHGDEDAPTDTMEELQQESPEVSDVVGFIDFNPSGSRLRTRLTSSKHDTNRICSESYVGTTPDEEHVRDSLIKLKNAKYRWLIDSHNTATRDKQNSNQGFVIVPESLIFPENKSEPDKELMRMIGAMGLKRVVAEPDWMLEGRLLGRYDLPGTKITTEWPRARTKEEARQAAASGVLAIKRLLGIEPIKPLDIEILHINDFIRRDKDPGKRAYNFKFCLAKGYWPILYDNKVDSPIEGSYRSDGTPFLGLTANKITKGTVYSDGSFKRKRTGIIDRLHNYLAMMPAPRH